MVLWETRACLAVLQEYYELVKKEDAYIAVEKNAAGSRPKELFEDALEEVEAAYEVARAALKVRRRGGFELRVVLVCITPYVRALSPPARFVRYVRAIGSQYDTLNMVLRRDLGRCIDEPELW